MFNAYMLQSKRSILFLIVFFVAVFMLSLYLYANDELKLITYTTSDWLINYQGGLVRRGLIGQLIYVATNSSKGMLRLMFVLQFIVAIATLILILKIYFEQKKSIEWVLFLLSPGFYISYFLYDTHSALRKESLVFLAMALIINGVGFQNLRKQLLSLAVLVYGIAVFSHELASLCLPFLLYPIAMKLNGTKNSSKFLIIIAVSLILISMSGLCFATLFKGDEKIVRDICLSLTNRGLDEILCEYSIAYLASNPVEAFNYVQSQVASRPYVPLYLICITFGIFPFTLTNWLSKRSTRFLIAIGIIAFLPLFITGIDWGRWIHLFLVLLTLSFFWYASQYKLYLKKIPGWTILLFITLWTLPAIVSRPDSILSRYVTFLPNIGLVDVAYRKLKEPPKRDFIKNAFDELIKPYKRIIFYPLEFNSDLQHYFALQALLHGKSTNANWINIIGSFSFLKYCDQGSIDKNNEKLSHDLERQIIDSSALYFFPKNAQSFVQLFPIVDENSDALFSLGPSLILAPNWHLCSKCSRVNLPRQFDLTLINQIRVDTPITFKHSKNGINPFLTKGWSEFAEDWGVWSVDRSAQLILPMPNAKIKIIRLKVRAFILGASQIQTVRVLMDGSYLKTVTLRRFENNEIVIEVNPESDKKIIKLDFDILEARSPKSIGVSDDQRLLGIGLQSIIFH